jgi:beta-N-acetylhexosaminidase
MLVVGAPTVLRADGGGEVTLQPAKPVLSSPEGSILADDTPVYDTGVSLDIMIGQMLMVGFGGTSEGAIWADTVRDQVAKGIVGGVFFLHRNIKNMAQLQKLTRYFTSANKELPPFLAIDQEGGRVQRLTAKAGFETSPSAAAVARDHGPDGAAVIYRRMADQLRAAGLNLNLGPVVDVNVNPANPVIAKLERSYGADPQVVYEFSSVFVAAHRKAGVLTALKHYPGHGNSSTDSHLGFVDISDTWTKRELEPYYRLAKARAVDFVMVGHLYHRDFADGERTPATLSRKAVSERLRGVMGDDVVVITDDMEMGAIRKLYSKEQAIVRAIAAGNDVLLYAQTANPSRNFPLEFIQIVKQAIAADQIDPKDIEASYRRIVRLKQRLR